jgi:hypothetical protein
MADVSADDGRVPSQSGPSSAMIGSMVALRSRRLETLLGMSLDDLEGGYENVKELVDHGASEAFDLDFKRDLYGNGEKERHNLATDVAALANTAGGLLILGIDEDRQARATAVRDVAISDDEMRRMLQIIGSFIVPLPIFDIIPVLKPGESGHGFLAVAIPRSPLAPHAVIVNQSLRYPRRNGTTTRYLSEPEVATAYRERLAGTQRQAARIEGIEREALQRINPSAVPWVVVSLVPDLPGELAIDSEVFKTFRAEIMGSPVTFIPLTGTRFRRASVGPRRLLADGTMDSSPLASWAALELHTDGAGAYGLRVPDLMERRTSSELPTGGEPRLVRVQDEALVIAIMSGLLRLAQHAHDRAAAGGNVLVRAQIYPISPEHPTGLGQTRFQGFLDALGDRVLTSSPPPAEAAAELDGLTQAGPDLVAASALLVDQLAHAFGLAEMGQVSRDGQIRRRYWSGSQVIAWAEQQGIEVTDETIA